MQDSIFIIFLGFAAVWIVIGVTAIIALFKSDGQEIRFGKWGLTVAIPILVPFILVLLYQVFRPFILPHFLN
jgi:hypothetical protein